MTGCIFTIIAFPFVGEAFGRLLGPAQRYLAGAGLTGTWLFLAGVAGLRVSTAALILFASAALVITLRQRTETSERLRYPLLPTVILGCLAAWLLWTSSIVPLADYDGRAFWLLKAKALAHEQHVDGPFFQLKTTSSPRNQYPLLLPLDAALTMIVGRQLEEWHARWLYVCFGIAFALEIRRQIGRLFSPALGAWCGAALLSLPTVVSPDVGAASAGGDVALGGFIAAAFFDMVAAESPLRFGMWLSFAALTKNEGFPAAVLLLAVGAFTFRRRIATAAVPLIVTLGALFVWKARVPRSDESPFARLLFELPSHHTRFWGFLAAFGKQPASLRTWGLFWLLFLVAIVILMVQSEWRPLVITGAVILPMVVLYSAVVAVTDWEPGVIIGLAPRLLVHLLGPAFYAIASAWHHYMRNTPNRGSSIGALYVIERPRPR